MQKKWVVYYCYKNYDDTLKHEHIRFETEEEAEDYLSTATAFYGDWYEVEYEE